MNSLLNWLLLQKGGVRTHLEFQQKALELRAAEPEYAAILRLLADLAGRFADNYESQPLSVDVATRARDQLAVFLTRAVDPRIASVSYHLELLNEIAGAEPA